MEGLSLRESRILEKWNSGTDVRKFELAIMEVACSGIALVVWESNSFRRWMIYQVAFHWNLRIRARVIRRFRGGGPAWLAPDLKLVEIHIARPEVYERPKRTLLEMKNAIARIRNTKNVMDVKAHTLDDDSKQEFAEIPPLHESEPCWFELLPKDVICLIMSMLSLSSLAKLARASKLFSVCASRNEVWTAQCKKLLESDSSNVTAFRAVGNGDEKLGRESKTLLQEVILEVGKHSGGMCSKPLCFSTCSHAHGRVFHVDSKVVVDKMKNDLL